MYNDFYDSLQYQIKRDLSRFSPKNNSLVTPQLVTTLVLSLRQSFFYDAIVEF